MRGTGCTVGFVPTMGALHQGHLELVRRALDACDKVVCSIFVNPLQFNSQQDLAKYPRQPGRDRELLQEVGCHVLFSPTDDALFKDFKPAVFNLGGLDQHWEGPSRPGHFQGVANVVERLFHYVRPDRAYFGEKDRQQLTMIRYVATDLHWPEEVIPCPTLRQPDGLALSSRNQRLSEPQRKSATVLYRSLQAASQMAFKNSVQDTRGAALLELAAEPDIVVDHFGIAHPDTLAPLNDWGQLDHAIALVAATVGPVRLIDNITLVR